MSETNAAVSSVMPTYSRFPISITKGEGSYVWDENGKQYLDYTAGIATCNLGHAPASVKGAVKEQLDTLWHCSNLYHIPIQEQLANLLTANTFADQVFFANSGAEANEAAIKLARSYAQKVKATSAYEVVTFSQSFHGRTLATLAATGQEKIQKHFAPLAKGFRYLPYNDNQALEELIGPNTCGVLLELVQGEGGVIPADPAWVKEVERLCKEHDVLLMLDEVQTGVGRTGTLYAYEQYGVQPDVMTTAKGLGSGIPIGAMLATEKAAAAFEAGSHGSTFGGNPVAAAAGKATLDVIAHTEFLAEVQEIADYFREELQTLVTQSSAFTDVRGKGLLLGLGTSGKAIELVHQARELGLLVLVAGEHVLRILPPLNTSKAEIEFCLETLKQITIV
ncbi:acetylornithine aminotransferase apoenzyme [Terribacillus aidingensis]|uniref:Acetylornithine aminotransferase n=1 Tax=Terribacillus aidingensis TaxID=586416 RepID=A0A285N5D7_9BACI|nr:acetylornithine transaminase [Terribacillus aidingensis]SNZ04067.1 acetylornithine aminotransferase apoenzyme [Terribacillus aidingensis]